MAATVSIYVEDVNERIETFDRIQVYRDTRADGAFDTLVTEITLVADQKTYSYNDTNGSSDSWYQYRFYEPSTLTSSDYSNPWQVFGATLENARFLAAELTGNAFRGETTAADSLLTDTYLKDAGYSSDFLKGAWVFRPSGTDADKVRRLTSAPFSATAATLTPTRDWSNQWTVGERYQVFTTLPPKPIPGFPYSWDQSVRDGLRYIWLIDEVTVGEGDSVTREFAVGAYRSVDRKRIRVVKVRSTASDGSVTEVDANTQGNYWSLRENNGELVLVLNGAPASGTTVVVELHRNPDPVWQDDDYVEMDEELVACAAALAAYRQLNRMTPTRGQYMGEEAGMVAELKRRYEHLKPDNALVGLS